MVILYCRTDFRRVVNREETTRQRYTSEHCGFELGDCVRDVKACVEELKGKVNGGI
jgi:hypothetical protein